VAWMLLLLRKMIVEAGCPLWCARQCESTISSAGEGEGLLVVAEVVGAIMVASIYVYTYIYPSFVANK
jgi:hypothetical protein